MKLKRVIKITLLVFGLVITLLLMILMYYVLIEEREAFDYSMLVPLIMIPFGILSVAFHFKTLKFYKEKLNEMHFKEALLWLGNALFAMSLVLTSLYLLYHLYPIDFGSISTMDSELFIAFLICVFILIFGVCLFIEENTLYKRLLNNKNQLFKDIIDDIKGHQEDEA